MTITNATAANTASATFPARRSGTCPACREWFPVGTVIQRTAVRPLPIIDGRRADPYVHGNCAEPTLLLRSGREVPVARALEVAREAGINPAGGLRPRPGVTDPSIPNAVPGEEWISNRRTGCRHPGCERVIEIGDAIIWEPGRGARHARHGR